MNAEQTRNTRVSYDRLAEEYARRIYVELEDKPRDRAILDAFAERLSGRGVVCDMGCGPGQIARYLKDRGLETVGVDLSSGMLEQARTLNPDIPFYVGDMTKLNVPDSTWAGIAAFYSIIHVPRAQVAAVLRELHRVLQPGGLLLLAFHLGDSELHQTELWEQQVDLDFWFFSAVEMLGYLEQAGFVVEQVIERDPYPPDIEYQSRRAYILAVRL